jgi:steroid 5-alpha reductase family enzyme
MVLLTLLPTALVSLVAAVVFMSLMFVLGCRLRRYDIVDAAWGLVFIVIAATSLLFNDHYQSMGVIIFALVTLWGLRLSSHILRRILATASEDKRYVEMRKKWRAGNENVAIFFRIYVVQAVLATVISLPVIVSMATTVEASPVVIVAGVLLWLAGFSIEATADRQLRQFIANRQLKGQLMTQGVWRYSRHPNYFGELVQWWAVGLLALSLPFGWIGLLGPLLISYLIIFVSGIPPTETAFAGRDGWLAYKRQTSVLVPWFVKKNGAK